MVTTPAGAEVLSYLGWPSDAALLAQADLHAAQAAVLTKAYCRGRGFTAEGVEGDIASVIVSYAARSLSNPSSAREVEAGSFKESPGSAWSFSLMEYVILQGYRRMAG